MLFATSSPRGNPAVMYSRLSRSHLCETRSAGDWLNLQQTQYRRVPVPYGELWPAPRCTCWCHGWGRSSSSSAPCGRGRLCPTTSGTSPTWGQMCCEGEVNDMGGEKAYGDLHTMSAHTRNEIHAVCKTACISVATSEAWIPNCPTEAQNPLYLHTQYFRRWNDFTSGTLFPRNGN